MTDIDNTILKAEKELTWNSEGRMGSERYGDLVEVYVTN